MGGKADTPKTPDYAALATQQAALNSAQANANTLANRPNVTTPTGSTTWTTTPGKAMINAADYFAANPDVAANFLTGPEAADGHKMSADEYALFHFNNAGKQSGRSINAAGDKGLDLDINGVSPTSYTEDQQLNPGQQALFDKAQRNQGGALDLAYKGQTNADASLGIQAGQIGAQSDALAAARASLATPSNFASELSPVGAVAGPTAGSVSYDANARDKATDALYARQTQYLDPQWQLAENQRRTELLSSGLSEDSDAYKSAMSTLGLAKQKAYADARDSAIASGGTEATQELGRGLAAEQNTFGESKDISNFNQSEATRQQNATLQNIGVQSNDRQQSLKDFLSLLTGGGASSGSLSGASGSGYTVPTLPGTAGTADQIAGTDLNSVATNAYNGQVQAANVQNAQAAQNTQNYIKIAGTIASLFV